MKNKPEYEAGEIHGTEHILFVEDEKVVRNITTEMMKRLGYKVTSYNNGKEAVEFYRINWRSVDLVIIDMVMPVMSGKETFTAMRTINPDIKALLASGYSIDGEAQAIIDEGVKGFMGLGP